ncbi:GLPGLI family protein [Psychroflexus gondwanensis]|jgi:GLPGLI family protein|uniref:Porph ging superfamily protein n=1 Tax=Psychroflexus gondwanensis ACAM 44 TaxID=1189619 RepID=N1WQQ2_9FLAO|nr:GLPGLI family protein [Psychroflexus gondwanensis]EMY81315.1 porph ging superfamily protein [Psychroflexus gondwanensis ACAM 44]TXE16640.1 GLPGLI family protein [Psychroflexus gondwanensis]
MKSILFKFSGLVFIALLPFSPNVNAQEFQGQAIYSSKAKMELGSFGARMSEGQKKQIQARLKNRLEKTYTLNFNKEESVFNEDEKIDAISGATDSWGDNFSRGEQYKNVKEKALIQSQEFYGKKFLVKDKLAAIEWKMGAESKLIGQYMCFKATASVPTDELEWYNFSWGDISETNTEAKTDSTAVETEELEIKTTEVEAWYTLQIPVSHGPGEYWGLPGLILEVSTGNTVMLCSKIVINPEEEIEIEAPDKGKEITKNDYQATIQEKMLEMRNNRGRPRS